MRTILGCSMWNWSPKFLGIGVRLRIRSKPQRFYKNIPQILLLSSVGKKNKSSKNVVAKSFLPPEPLQNNIVPHGG